jgi:hypothetical protein
MHNRMSDRQSSPTRRRAAFASVLVLSTVASAPPIIWTSDDEKSVRWPAPELNEESFGRWLKFIRPSNEELKWRQVRWHKHLSDAAEEARRLERPILLYTMNGHPCGET